MNTLTPPAEGMERIGASFQIPGRFLHAMPHGNGHINETYAATYNQAGRNVRYIHQQINERVFKDPVALMENVSRVTAHQHEKLDAAGCPDRQRRALTTLPATAGLPYHRDEAGKVWRTYQFIEGARTLDAVESPAQAFQAALAFGEFQKALADLSGTRLHETIPDFHHTPKRFAALVAAVENDPCNRAREARYEIQMALDHEPMTRTLVEAQAAGLISERITHNDTKLNNVMLDEKTMEGLCVIDLDTVMPGLVLYDFGDMVRTTTSPAAEDERDLSLVRMQMPMFQALVDGYLTSANSFLTPGEKDHLAFSGKLIAFEIGIRFLTDFLQGDTYFKIRRHGHNLDRCRTQFRLVESIESQEEAMRKIVHRWEPRP